LTSYVSFQAKGKDIPRQFSKLGIWEQLRAATRSEVKRRRAQVYFRHFFWL